MEITAETILFVFAILGLMFIFLSFEIAMKTSKLDAKITSLEKRLEFFESIFPTPEEVERMRR